MCDRNKIKWKIPSENEYCLIKKFCLGKTKFKITREIYEDCVSEYNIKTHTQSDYDTDKKNTNLNFAHFCLTRLSESFKYYHALQQLKEARITRPTDTDTHEYPSWFIRRLPALSCATAIFRQIGFSNSEISEMIGISKDYVAVLNHQTWRKWLDASRYDRPSLEALESILTPRQLKVWLMAEDGLRINEIARELKLSQCSPAASLCSSRKKLEAHGYVFMQSHRSERGLSVTQKLKNILKYKTLLTDLQVEYIKLRIAGQSNKQIADRYGETKKNVSQTIHLAKRRVERQKYREIALNMEELPKTLKNT